LGIIDPANPLLTEEDKDNLCNALLLFVYKGHVVGKYLNAPQIEFHLSRVNLALNLAEKIGLRRRLLNLILEHPVLTVVCSKLNDKDQLISL